MRHLWLLLLLPAYACTVPCPGMPGPTPVHRGVGVDGHDWDSLETYITDELEGSCIPSLSVAIVTPEETLWSAAFGWADIESAVAASPDTVYMLASVSKTWTAAALMLAVEDGAVALDDRVSKHVPFKVENPLLGGNQPPMRVAHLASHTSGIQDNWDEIPYRKGDPAGTLKGYLRSYLTENGDRYHAGDNFHPWEPGTAYSYSNVATALAGLTVQEAVGLPFEDYCAERLFTPLGLETTHWFLRDFDADTPMAVPYEVDRDGWVPREHYGYPTWPDGQLRTTASELARFLGMVMAGGTWDGVQVMAPETVDAMLRSPLTGAAGPAPSSVTDGQYVFWGDARKGRIGHNGGDPGVHTRLYFDPQTEVGVVMLTNFGSFKLGLDPVFAFNQVEDRLFEVGADVRRSR